MQGIYGVDALCCFRDADTLGATGHYLGQDEARRGEGTLIWRIVRPDGGKEPSWRGASPIAGCESGCDRRGGGL